MGNSGQFKPGNRLGVKGRPKGIIDKRMRLNKALMGNADALLKIATEKANAGDGQMLTLLLSRAIAPLRPEGTPVRFALDASQTTSKQIEQLLQALADGQLTVDEAKQIAEVVRLLAEARAADGTGDSIEKLSALFKELAPNLPV